MSWNLLECSPNFRWISQNKWSGGGKRGRGDRVGALLKAACTTAADTNRLTTTAHLNEEIRVSEMADLRFDWQISGPRPAALMF